MPDTTAWLAAALRRVGDRWSLLVVAALLEGPARFGEVQKAVPGIATNVLTSRLRDLERERVLVSTPYSERPLRFEYELTAAGAELAGALKMLAAWGASTGSQMAAGDLTEPDAMAPIPVHSVCGTPLEIRYWCPTCQQPGEVDEDVWA